MIRQPVLGMVQRYSNASRTSISFRYSRRPSRHQIRCLDRSSALHIERILSIDSPLPTPKFHCLRTPLPRKPYPGRIGTQACHKHIVRYRRSARPSCLFRGQYRAYFRGIPLFLSRTCFQRVEIGREEGGRSPWHPQSLMAAPGACGRLVFAQAAHAQPLTTPIGHPWDRRIIDYIPVSRSERRSRGPSVCVGLERLAHCRLQFPRRNVHTEAGFLVHTMTLHGGMEDLVFGPSHHIDLGLNDPKADRSFCREESGNRTPTCRIIPR